MKKKDFLKAISNVKQDQREIFIVQILSDLDNQVIDSSYIELIKESGIESSEDIIKILGAILEKIKENYAPVICKKLMEKK